MSSLITYPLPVASGTLHLMPCPEPEPRYFFRLAEYGIETVVSLLQPMEATILGLAEEARLCAMTGMTLTSFPVPDHGTPQDKAAFAQLATSCHRQLQTGKTLAVHCFAGIGRTGLLSAAILMREGLQVDQALLKLSRARGVRMPETRAQIQWLHRYHQEFHTP